MPRLFLYQSKEGKKIPFSPINSKKIGFYACGPTVYDRIHLGNGRTFLFFDILFRLLKFLYPEVIYVQNITDVDDKINNAVQERKEDIYAFTENRIQWFLEDTQDLGLLSPTFQPRATNFISNIIDLITDLLAKGYAYESQGHVLFNVASWPLYGSLSNRHLTDMIEGARVEIAPYKKDPLDFVLWKPSQGETIGWNSPWGYGRPGWHSECSVMSYHYLGAHFDLHGGGQDLLFPHHENERAQVCAQKGTKEYANYWVHCGMLVVHGQKMSKSLGNFITLRDGLNGLYGYSIDHCFQTLYKNLEDAHKFNNHLKEKHMLEDEDSFCYQLEKQRHSHILRWALLSSHYRQELNWTKELYEISKDHIHHLYKTLLKCVHMNPKEYPDFVEALCDDVNTTKALNIIINLVKNTQENPEEFGPYLWFACDLLGFHIPKDCVALEELTYPKGNKQLKYYVSWILSERSKARAEKNYELSDQWRNILQKSGITIQDHNAECQWFIK